MFFFLNDFRPKNRFIGQIWTSSKDSRRLVSHRSPTFDASPYSVLGRALQVWIGQFLHSKKVYFEELIVINLFLMTHHYSARLLLRQTDQTPIRPRSGRVWPFSRWKNLEQANCVARIGQQAANLPNSKQLNKLRVQVNEKFKLSFSFDSICHLLHLLWQIVLNFFFRPGAVFGLLLHFVCFCHNSRHLLNFPVKLPCIGN